MNDNAFENWDLKKEKIIQEHPSVNRDDLIYEIGKEAELLARLEKKLKKNRTEIRNWLCFLG